MKTIKVYSDKDCVIRYAVWPEEPVLNMLDAFSNKRKEKWGDPLAHYSNALQKAKDESVCFEDQEQIKKRMYPDNKHKVNASYGEWEAEGLKPDTFYDIEFDGEIEVVEVPEYPIDHTSYPPYIKVARLLLSKEETREMTPTDPLSKTVFSLDIHRLRATQTDAEFRRLVFQMLAQKNLLIMESKVGKVEDKPEHFKTDPERNWTEDFTHENGNYINKCIECNLYFKGHKRRVICRMCAEPDWQKIADMKQPEDNKHAHAGCWAQGEMVGFARCMIKHVEPLKQKIKELEAEITRLKDEKAP